MLHLLKTTGRSPAKRLRPKLQDMNINHYNSQAFLVKLGIPALRLPRPLPPDAFIRYRLTPDGKHLRAYDYDYDRAAEHGYRQLPKEQQQQQAAPRDDKPEPMPGVFKPEGYVPEPKGKPKHARTEESPKQAPEQKLPADYIILPSGPLGIYEAAEKAFQLLARAQKIFLRGGAVFHLVNNPDDGLLKLEPLTEQTFRSRIERHGKILAWRAAPASRGYLLKADARCSLDNTAAMLASEAKNILPPIAALHNCPILIESAQGEITFLGRGYHRDHGGRLIVTGTEPQHIPIEEAVELLLDMISEYEFVTPADKSRALAAIIAPALKFGELLKTHFPSLFSRQTTRKLGKGSSLSQSKQSTGKNPPLYANERAVSAGSMSPFPKRS